MRIEEDYTPPALPLPVEPAQRYAFLVVIDGPQVGKIFALESDRELVLGRRVGVEVELRDACVSRRHALLTVERGGALITDLSTLNGTWVNGRRVPAARIVDGDRITLGAHTSLKFVYADAREARYLLQLAESNRHDPVTGLRNERGLLELLHAELSAAQRRARPVSVLAIGVDDLRNLVGRHGHRVGDEVQRMVAFVLQSSLRKEDLTAALGDGRVFVVAREADPAGVQPLASRIRQAVKHSEFVLGVGQDGVTVSIGVATMATLPDQPLEEASGRLLEAAWGALETAQQRGRSQVAVLRLPVAVA